MKVKNIMTMLDIFQYLNSVENPPKEYSKYSSEDVKDNILQIVGLQNTTIDNLRNQNHRRNMQIKDLKNEIEALKNNISYHTEMG